MVKELKTFTKVKVKELNMQNGSFQSVMYLTAVIMMKHLYVSSIVRLYLVEVKTGEFNLTLTYNVGRYNL